MARRARATKHELIPDAKYQSLLLSKLVNHLMKDGKKSTAERVVYDAMTTIEQKESKAAVGVLEQAVKNATPQLEVKSRRIGGANYQVPIEVRTERGLALAFRWLISSARSRPGKSMQEKLAAELTDAAKGEGTTIKKRDDTHRMAEANRAFAHYRW